MISKAEKSRMSRKDFVNFYITIVRSQLEYATPVFPTSLPNYLVEKLEYIQKRAMYNIFPDLKYTEAMRIASIITLEERKLTMCKAFFKAFKIKTVFYHSYYRNSVNQNIVLEKVQNI